MKTSIKIASAIVGMGAISSAAVIVIPQTIMRFDSPPALPYVAPEEFPLSKFDVEYFRAKMDDRATVLLDCASAVRRGPVCTAAEEAERLDGVPPPRKGLTPGAQRALAILNGG